MLAPWLICLARDAVEAMVVALMGRIGEVVLEVVVVDGGAEVAGGEGWTDEAAVVSFRS